MLKNYNKRQEPQFTFPPDIVLFLSMTNYVQQILTY